MTTIEMDIVREVTGRTTGMSDSQMYSIVLNYRMDRYDKRMKRQRKIDSQTFTLDGYELRQWLLTNKMSTLDLAEACDTTNGAIISLLGCYTNLARTNKVLAYIIENKLENSLEKI